jgi:hypothetical protein
MNKVADRGVDAVLFLTVTTALTAKVESDRECFSLLLGLFGCQSAQHLLRW